MTTPFRIHVAGRTDVGLIREHNEDNLTVVDLEARRHEELKGVRELRVEDRGALLIVCDGMGGAAAGEVASAMAIEAVSRYVLGEMEGTAPPLEQAEHKLRVAGWLRKAAYDANRRIFEASRADDNHAGMGTTMTTVAVVRGDLVMAQVGDSRAYVLRQGKLVQVTRDQSLVNQLIETGQISEADAREFEHSNVILQALGVQDEVEVLISTVPLRRGDRVVVCTDGLTGVVTDEELEAVLGSTEDMDEVCRLLVEMARVGGGPDNITVVAARFDDPALPPPADGEVVRYERWKIDASDEPSPPEPPPPPSLHGTEGTRRRRSDPARTFFSLMMLLALSLGGLVTAAQLRRSGGVACTLVGEPGLAVRIDGYDVGQRTQGARGLSLRLPRGPHKVALRQRGGTDNVRQIEVADGECRVMFDGAEDPR